MDMIIIIIILIIIIIIVTTLFSPFTPTVKHQVTFSLLTSDSMERPVKCEPFIGKPLSCTCGAACFF